WRLPWHPRAALPDLSRIGAGEGRAAVAAGPADRRPGRPRLRDALRAHRAALDRAAGRAPGATHLARTALVACARRGDRARTGHIVRIDAGGTAHRHLREAGPAARAFDLPARSAGTLRTGCARGLRARQRAGNAAGARDRGAAAPGGRAEIR